MYRDIIKMEDLKLKLNESTKLVNELKSKIIRLKCYNKLLTEGIELKNNKIEFLEHNMKQIIKSRLCDPEEIPDDITL